MKKLQEIVSAVPALLESHPELVEAGVDASLAGHIWARLCGADDMLILSVTKYKSVDELLLAERSNAHAAAVRILAPLFLETVAAPASIGALYAVATDKDAPAGARTQAANSLLDRSHLALRVKDAASGASKTPEQMSIDELTAAIDELEKEAGNRALDVSPIVEETGDSAPAGARHDDQLLDLM